LPPLARDGGKAHRWTSLLIDAAENAVKQRRCGARSQAVEIVEIRFNNSGN